MKKALKITAVILTVILVLIVAALLLTQTAFFRDKARAFALERVNKLLNAELYVGSLEGNLFSHIELLDVGLVRDQDTLAHIGRLSLDFHALPILSKRIEVSSLVIDSLSADLRQNADSSWNFSNLVRTDTLDIEDSLEAGFAYKIMIDKLAIQNSRASVLTLDTASVIPARIEEINLRLSAELDSAWARLDLAELRFDAFDPDLRLERLEASAARDGDEVTVDRLLLQTARNRLSGSGAYAGNFSGGAVKIETGPLDLSEFAAFGLDFELEIAPQLKLSASLAGDTLFADIDVSAEENARGSFDIVAHPFSQLFDSTKVGQVGYQIRSVLRNIDVARWTGDTTFAYTINGEIALGGAGITPRTMRDSLAADLSDCLVLGRKVGPAVMRLTYDRGNLTGTMDINGVFGGVNFDAIAIDLLETQEYRLSFSTRNLGLAQLLNNDSLRSDLNLEILADGVGFDMKKASGDIGLGINKSVIYDAAIDSGFVTGSFAPESYIVDTAFITSAYGVLSAAGEFGREEDRGLDIKFNLDDLHRLKALLGTDTLGGSVAMDGQVTGRLDSIVAAGRIRLSELLYNTIWIDSGSIDFGATRNGEALAAEALIGLDGMTYGSYSVDSLSTRINYSNSGISVAAEIDKDPTHKARIETDITLGETFSAGIRKIEFEMRDRRWSGGSDRTAISGSNGTYTITDFELLGGDAPGGGRQSIRIDGRFSLNSTEDLTIDVNAFDIGLLTEFSGGKYDLGGFLSGNLSLTGSAAEPRLDGKFAVRGGSINKVPFDSLTARLDFVGQRLEWDALLAAQPTSSITARGFLPMLLSFAESGADTGQLIIGDKPMEVIVDINKFPFAMITAAEPEIENAKGWIDGGVRFVNTMNRPSMSGNIIISEAGFELPELGGKYEDLAMALSFTDDVIRLDSLSARRGKGYILVRGDMEFDSSLISGSLRRSNFDLHADDFFLARSSGLELQVSGDANVSGSSRSPGFSGNITIDRSRIFTPLLTDESAAGAEEFEGKPMLVAATRPDTALADTGAAAGMAGQAEVEEPNDYIENLRGSMTLTIPRDTWLRSPDMNIEISGDIQMVKDSPQLFELFGPISIIRGEYTLYGKEFKITEGQLTFTGGREYNPDIDLEAEYVFRSPEREKRALVLHITGKALQPTLAFRLDGAEITQTNAVAYVVFGRSMEDVTGSGGLAMNGGGEGELAKGLAGRLVTGQLTKSLGKGLALDVVDIKASESLRGATIAIGKYVTSNIFMSYQRGIGQVTESENHPDHHDSRIRIQPGLLGSAHRRGAPEKRGGFSLQVRDKVGLA